MRSKVITSYVKYSDYPKIHLLFKSIYYNRDRYFSILAKKWYSFLKKKHLFKYYMENIYVLLNRGGYSEKFYCADTYDKILFICRSIDELISKNYVWANNHYWQDVYEDFFWETEAPKINHIMANKLYMTNKKDKPHSKYIGSSELRKSLYDKIVDGFFNLFK